MAGQLKVDEILNSAGTGAFAAPQGVVLGSSALAAPSGSAPSYTCRAWVNFDGTGTVAIRAAGNVSSITDNGTGDYTVNFTTAMPDANYVAIPDGSSSGVNLIAHGSATGTPKTVSAYRVQFQNAANAFFDPQICDIAIFR